MELWRNDSKCTLFQVGSKNRFRHCKKTEFILTKILQWMQARMGARHHQFSLLWPLVQKMFYLSYKEYTYVSIYRDHGYALNQKFWFPYPQ